MRGSSCRQSRMISPVRLWVALGRPSAATEASTVKMPYVFPSPAPSSEMASYWLLAASSAAGETAVGGGG